MEIVKVYDEHLVRRKLPINILKKDLRLFSHDSEFHAPSAHILFAKHALILDYSIFADFKFLKSYYHVRRNYLSFSQKLLRIISLAKPIKVVKKGVWIIDNWSDGYYHWLTDALPRLINALPYIDDHYVLIPKRFEAFKYVKESLRLLKVNVLFYDQILKVNDLVIPSHAAPMGHYNEDVIKKLRQSLILNKHPLMPGGKFFVSRAKAPRRKILNEKDLFNVLLRYNYEIVYLEDYSFEEQISLINRAKVLIGLHGAGLTNMLFMQESAIVFELRNNGDDYNNCYFSLASALNLSYFYQNCLGTSADTQNVDVKVELVEFEENLKIIEKVISN